MRYFLAFFLLAASLQAAEITVTVKNDAGVVISTVTVTTTNQVLTTVNNWRLSQILTPAQLACPLCKPPVAPAPAVLQYPTIAALWRSVIREFVKPLLINSDAGIIAELGKIDAANAAVEKLKDQAIQ